MLLDLFLVHFFFNCYICTVCWTKLAIHVTINTQCRIISYRMSRGRTQLKPTLKSHLTANISKPVSHSVTCYMGRNIGSTRLSLSFFTHSLSFRLPIQPPPLAANWLLTAARKRWERGRQTTSVHFGLTIMPLAALNAVFGQHLIAAYYSLIDPERMKG